LSSDHWTYHYDVGRTGLNPSETALTPAKVMSSFGLLHTLQVDSTVDAQPLYLSQLTVGGGPHNVVYVATEADSVYAFDADTGATLWKSSLLLAGETPSDPVACDQILPTIGVTSTPVIDRGAGKIFLVAMSKDGSGAYHQRLHALDITTGKEVTGSPREISATYFGTSFAPGYYAERAALLLSGGTIYTSWTSHCDNLPYGGWIIAYSESTLSQVAALNVAVGSNDKGPAIWMAGNGPAADAAGNVYLITANGVFDTVLNGNGFPSNGDFGNSILKLSLSGSSLQVADYFTPYNTAALSDADEDLGSGGELVLPDLTDAGGKVRHLVAGAGKTGIVYLADRDSMGKFSPTQNNVYQQVSLSNDVFSSPAYFNKTLYYCPIGGPVVAYPISQAQLASAPSSISNPAFAFNIGCTPAISANGATNGIVWAQDTNTPAALHAYDATNLATTLYTSTDNFGPGNKFAAPVVIDGKVLVAGGLQSGVAVVAVFGLH
jgi:hypothetical protein